MNIKSMRNQFRSGHLAVISVLCVVEGSAMIDAVPPGPITHETQVSGDLPEFLTCKEAAARLALNIGAEVRQTTYTRSDGGQYILRATISGERATQFECRYDPIQDHAEISLAY